MADRSKLWQDEKGVWHCRYYAGGTTSSPRIRKTLGKIPAKDAKRAYAALIARARARGGRLYLRASLADCAESWAELRAPKLAPSWAALAAKWLEERLLPAFGGRPADELDAAEVERYRQRRLAEDAAPGSVNREVGVLMSVLAHGVSVGLLDRHPFPRGAVKPLKEPKGRLIYFEPDEWAHFRAAFDDPAAWEQARGEIRDLRRRDRPPGRPGGALRPEGKASHEYRARLRSAMPVFEALLLTGSRLSEILSLTWADVDLERGTVRVFQGKTTRPKTLPVSPELRAVLERAKGPGPVFPGSHVFQRPGGGRWERDKVYDSFVLAKRIAGLRPELVIHSLRHTAGSWMAIAERPLKEIQEMLGHASATTTQKYIHLQPQHLATSAAVLGRLSRG